MRCALVEIACVVLLSRISGPGCAAAPIELVVPGNSYSQPSLNDSLEVVYGTGSGPFSIVSTTRGVLASGNIDFSNLGVSNSGEVVYANFADEVTSTTRGILVTGGYAPTIAATTGEVAYTDGVDFFTTLHGKITTNNPLLFNIGPGDVNGSGEVVYELHELSTPFNRIYSTTRGYLSPPDVSAFGPAINNLGEVVWAENQNGHTEIFSSVRGQLTFFGGPMSFDLADFPDINEQGDVVFRHINTVGSAKAVEDGLYVIHAAPEPTGSLLIVVGATMLTLLQRARPRDFHAC